MNSPTHSDSPCAPLAYERRSVAVPFGGCTEPSDIKAGGQACPIRFQCSGCGFVIDNITAQITSSEEVSEKMRKRMAHMPDDVLAASQRADSLRKRQRTLDVVQGVREHIEAAIRQQEHEPVVARSDGRQASPASLKSDLVMAREEVTPHQPAEDDPGGELLMTPLPLACLRAADSGAECLPEEFAELGGVRGEAGVPAGEVLEFRAEALGQESGRTVGQLAA